MRKLYALGTALLIGGGLVAGAAPARAQIQCGPLISPICATVIRQVQHAEEELGHAVDTAYEYYDTVDRTVRCVVFEECP